MLLETLIWYITLLDCKIHPFKSHISPLHIYLSIYIWDSLYISHAMYVIFLLALLCYELHGAVSEREFLRCNRKFALEFVILIVEEHLKFIHINVLCFIGWIWKLIQLLNKFVHHLNVECFFLQFWQVPTYLERDKKCNFISKIFKNIK